MNWLVEDLSAFGGGIACNSPCEVRMWEQRVVRLTFVSSPPPTLAFVVLLSVERQCVHRGGGGWWRAVPGGRGRCSCSREQVP